MAYLNNLQRHQHPQWRNGLLFIKTSQKLFVRNPLLITHLDFTQTTSGCLLGAAFTTLNSKLDLTQHSTQLNTHGTQHAYANSSTGLIVYGLLPGINNRGLESADEVSHHAT